MSAAAPGPLRHNRDFRRLWIGEVLSDIGTGAATLAYPLLILALTHSPLLAGVLGTVESGVAIGLQLPGGALADRWNRRRTMVICNWARAIAFAILTVLIATDEVWWPVVAAVAILDASGAALYNPASTAALPAVVAAGQLDSAWAITEARQYASGLAGPALGGLMYAIASAFPFGADAVSYAIGAITAGQLHGDFAPQAPDARSHLLAEVVEGVVFCWRSPLIRPIVLITPLINFAYVGAEYTITLALRRNGVNASTIGLLQATVAAGGLVGALIATTTLIRRLGLHRLLILNAVNGTVLLAIADLIAPDPVFAIPIALILVPAPSLNAVLFSQALSTIADQLRGRVVSGITVTAMAVSTLAPLVTGLLLTHGGVHLTLAVFCGAMAIAVVISAVVGRAMPQPEGA